MADPLFHQNSLLQLITVTLGEYNLYIRETLLILHLAWDCLYNQINIYHLFMLTQVNINFMSMIINTTHSVQLTHQTSKLPLIVYHTILFDRIDSRIIYIDSETCQNGYFLTKLPGHV